MNCQFERRGDEWICTRCERTRPYKPGKTPAARCVVEEEPATVPSKGITILSPTMWLGGGERWMMALARYLSAPPVRRVIVSEGRWIHEPTLREMEQYAKVDLARTPDEWSKLMDLARPSTCAWLAWGLGAQWFEQVDLGGLPLIGVSHSSHEWTNLTIGTSMALCDHVASVSEMAIKGIPPDHRSRARVLYNGAEIERVVPAMGPDVLRQQLGFSRRDKVVLYVGRLSEEKCFTHMIEPLGILGRGWRGLIVGIGGEEPRERIRKMAEEARVDITCLPERWHLGDYYALADCLLLTSPHEGFALVVIEAWLAGCPVVSTPVGAAPELEREHGRLIWTVDHGSTPNAIAGQIRRVSRDDARVHRARRLAWEQFTAPAMAYRWQRWLATEVIAGEKLPGDRLADRLAAIGITKERFSGLLGRPCGCGKRQRAMNDTAAGPELR